MEIDLGAFLVIVYSVVDDLYRSKYAPAKPRRRGHKPELSDSEVLTLALLAQWQQSRSESAFVEYVTKHWQEYFPRMLTQGAFNRRARDLAGVPRELATDADRILPGEGDFRLEPIMDRLRAIGYDGWVSLELMNPTLWQVKCASVVGIGRQALQRLLKA